MATHDSEGRPYAKMSELKAGSLVRHDGGFGCFLHDDVMVVKFEEGRGLYVPCVEGKHFLEGQADDGEHCVGMRLITRIDLEELELEVVRDAMQFAFDDGLALYDGIATLSATVPVVEQKLGMEPRRAGSGETP